MLTLTQYTTIKKRIISLTALQQQDQQNKKYYTKRIVNLNKLISKLLQK